MVLVLLPHRKVVELVRALVPLRRRAQRLHDLLRRAPRALAREVVVRARVGRDALPEAEQGRRRAVLLEEDRVEAAARLWGEEQVRGEEVGVFARVACPGEASEDGVSRVWWVAYARALNAFCTRT